MIHSPLPWTMKVVKPSRELDNGGPMAAIIHDQAGKYIAYFDDSRDAELMLEQFTQVKELEEKAHKLECDIEELEC